ncbi:sulfite exporter TauE/SafE family protein [Rubripirellula amarantea]|nr:sulfite exporter TauE/SafE family protein [Rubripirellula amarantea]
MDLNLVTLVVLFFAVGAIYSAAGFGGGSSYLAILSYALTNFSEMRTLALVCNLVVVTGSVWLFWKQGHVIAKRVIPLVAISVPASFLAAQMRFSQATFFGLLGATLVTASLAMLIQPKRTDHNRRVASWWDEAAIGGGIGFLSGLVGIGGGIFLSPMLHLLRWDTAKRIAATASVFILVNSLAGLAGLLVSDQFQIGDVNRLWLLVAVLGGGQLGVRFCLSQVAATRIHSLTAVLVMIAGVRILWQAV